MVLTNSVTSARCVNKRIYNSISVNLALAWLTAVVKPASAARSKIGARRPRKSAPTRLKDRPKYMHCPRTESSRPPTPSWRSRSSVWRNWETWWKMKRNKKNCQTQHAKCYRYDVGFLLLHCISITRYTLHEDSVKSWEDTNVLLSVLLWTDIMFWLHCSCRSDRYPNGHIETLKTLSISQKSIHNFLSYSTKGQFFHRKFISH